MTWWHVIGRLFLSATLSSADWASNNKFQEATPCASASWHFCFQSKNSVASVVNAIRAFRVFRQLLDPLGQGICQSCLECLCCRFLWAKTATSGCENGWSQCKKASIVQTPGAKGARSEPSCKESATETFVKYMKNQDSLPTKTSIQ